MKVISLRVCPHVAVVVGLTCFNDLWGYAGKAIHAWLFPTERPDYEGPKVYAVRMRGRGTPPVRICSSDVTVEVDQQRCKN